MSEKDVYKIAKRRADSKLGFYIHSTVFLTVNAVMFAVNLLTTPAFLWAAFPFLGWGLGLGIHGLVIFAFGGGSGGSSAKNRLVANEMRRLQQLNEAASTDAAFHASSNRIYQPGGWMN